MLVELPHQFTDRAALAFARDISTLVSEPEVILDFRPVRFVYPYGTLLIAHAIKHFTTGRWVNDLKTSVLGHKETTGAVSYLKYFGFFKYINVDVGLDTNEAPGGSRYLPVTIVNRNTLTPQEPGVVFQDNIEHTSDRLAKVIFPAREEESAADMLSYCFRELIRNSFEHANITTCAVMAQRWDSGFAEVAIADRGIGIYRSLAKAHKVASPDDAVRLALKPGISSAGDKGTGSKWDNTGFGLYVVSQLGLRYGSFSMLSSGQFFNPVAEDQRPDPVSLPGTLVKLRIATRDAEYWPNILTNIVAEGEAEAKQIPGAITSASKGSRKSNTWDG